MRHTCFARRIVFTLCLGIAPLAVAKDDVTTTLNEIRNEALTQPHELKLQPAPIKPVASIDAPDSSANKPKENTATFNQFKIYPLF